MFSSLVTCGGRLKYALKDNNTPKNGRPSLARSASVFCDSWSRSYPDSSCRSFLSIQALAGRAGLLKARTKAFFTEKKEQHGRDLLPTFQQWIETEPLKFTQTFDSIFPDAPLDLIWVTARSPTGMVLVKERTYEYYANHHLETGYPLSWNGLQGILNTREKYERVSDEVIPLLKNKLREEVRKRCPTLREFVAPDRVEDCYNLDLLFSRLVERALGEGDLSFFDREMTQLGAHPEYGGWELVAPISSKQPFVGIGESVLLRTRDKDDKSRLRDGVDAVLLDATAAKHLGALMELIVEMQSYVANYKKALKDLVIGIELGQVIAGQCSICESWETFSLT